MKTEITMAIISRGIFTSIVPNDLVSICVSNRNATKKFGANVIPTNKKRSCANNCIRVSYKDMQLS